MKKYIPIFLILCFITLVSAHGDETFVKTDPGTISLVVLLSILASIVPLLIGLLSYNYIESHPELTENNYLIPLAIVLGFLIFLIYDIENSATLFSTNITNLGNNLIKFLLFGVVFIFLAYFSKSKGSRFPFYVWIFAIAIHTFAEGIIIGFNFQLGFAEALLPLPVLGYEMHKLAEGAIAAILYLISQKKSMKELWLATIASGLTIVPGALIGYLTGYFSILSDAGVINPYIYAIALAFTLFVVPFVIPQSFKDKKRIYFIFVFIGFLFLYIAGILHDI